MKNTYEQFQDGNELSIAELIQQRRYQILVHSCIYYHLNDNVISDKQWDGWARELVELQNKYPKIAEKVSLHSYFKDWDASTGAFLPITQDWVIAVAKHVLSLFDKSGKQIVEKKPVTEKKKSIKKKLF